jgi:hypothetical protein
VRRKTRDVKRETQQMANCHAPLWLFFCFSHHASRFTFNT